MPSIIDHIHYYYCTIAFLEPSGGLVLVVVVAPRKATTSTASTTS